MRFRFFITAKRYQKDVATEVAIATKNLARHYESHARMLADISHELQTPLTILKGNAELLERIWEFRRGGEAPQALRTFQSTLDGMSQLVEALAARGDAGFIKKRLKAERISLRKLIKEIWRDCAVLALDKGVAFKIFPRKLYISGDRKQLKEVLLNLLSNALKHTSRGGLIQLRVLKVGDNVAEIIFEDSGTGIAHEELQRIFERFYRIPGDSTHGTGLGLHICREIIEAHNGSIRAESELGKGSRFIISLPLFREKQKVENGNI